MNVDPIKEKCAGKVVLGNASCADDMFGVGWWWGRSEVATSERLLWGCPFLPSFSCSVFGKMAMKNHIVTPHTIASGEQEITHCNSETPFQESGLSRPLSRVWIGATFQDPFQDPFPELWKGTTYQDSYQDTPFPD